MVAEDAVRDDHICILADGDAWRVFYTERGILSQESVCPSKDDARAEIVHRLMSLSRVLLNNRYWHAHSLPFPILENDADAP